jgi:predicted DNA-binding transcriptional regulator YafY
MRGQWYVVGFSPERGALRRFRLSRIDEMVVTAQPFALPANFELGPPDPRTDLPVLVRLSFEAPQLLAMEERLSGFDAVLQADGTRCIATFRTHSEAAVASHVLSWGSAVHVLEPAALRERVVSEARRIVDNATDTLVSVAPV